ncbi:MAG: hypothetical protein HQL49_13400 [Gammaproteobacteria bacterium]|nr:hypothetical protein [Gammaproteobacteria bacterium]
MCSSPKSVTIAMPKVHYRAAILPMDNDFIARQKQQRLAALAERQAPAKRLRTKRPESVATGPWWNRWCSLIPPIRWD